MEPNERTVVILGASNREDRYSYKAFRMLKEHGFRVVPIHPALSDIEGVEVKASLDYVDQKVDTVTLYVGPKRLPDLLPAIVSLSPRRVVFNPGTELPEAQEELKSKGIEVVEGCTMVMIRNGNF
ncbi:MAG: CoA-binding protein [Chitinispirillaceae bacterium]